MPSESRTSGNAPEENPNKSQSLRKNIKQLLINSKFSPKKFNNRYPGTGKRLLQTSIALQEGHYNKKFTIVICETHPALLYFFAAKSGY
jgi:hypothetical protein